MTNRNAFVVEVTSPPRESREVLTGRVASQLSISQEKAASLVARVPGVITKPLPEERALRVVLRLQAAGLAAMHRRATPADAAGADQEPATPPSAAAATPAATTTPPPTSATTPEPPSVTATPVTATPVPEDDGGRPSAPTLDDDTMVADAGVRNPTDFDRIPSLDATLVDDPVEPDPKLTPMREAGFGAADVVIPTSRTSRPPTIVDVGGVSSFSDARIGSADDERGRTSADADPTMVMAPDDAPSTSARTTPTTAADGASKRATPVPGPAPASRLRDAIARDRDGGERPQRPTLTDDDLHATPPPDVAYRSTRTSAERPLTLTPPPDAMLKRSGVHDDDLPSSLERRRGRFGRRLSALVALPVTLSWLLSAAFIYWLLPNDLRGSLWVPLAAATAIAALTGALAAGLATMRIAGDVVRLRDDAQRIAMGDLTSSVGVRRDDELGDTAASVERLRVSLQEALERLRKRR